MFQHGTAGASDQEYLDRSGTRTGRQQSSAIRLLRQAMDTAPKDGTEIIAWVRWGNAPAGPERVKFERREWRRPNGRAVAKEILVFWLPTVS